MSSAKLQVNQQTIVSFLKSDGLKPTLRLRLTCNFAEALYYPYNNSTLYHSAVRAPAVGLFLALAFLIGLYALHRLAMVKEAGQVEEKIMAQELV
jgi:hypothetical protein